MRRPCAYHPTEILRVGRRIAADLAGEACEPASALLMADRMALAALALAVEAEAARRADIEPMMAEMLPVLSAALAQLECEEVPVHPAAPQATGSLRDQHHAL